MDGSGEKIIGPPAGCIKARSIERKPETDSWDADMMKSVQGTPWEVARGHKDKALQCRVIMDKAEKRKDIPGMPAEPEDIIHIIYITNLALQELSYHPT